jgi:hypothetical protein
VHGRHRLRVRLYLQRVGRHARRLPLARPHPNLETYKRLGINPLGVIRRLVSDWQAC